MCSDIGNRRTWNFWNATALDKLSKIGNVRLGLDSVL